MGRGETDDVRADVRDRVVSTLRQGLLDGRLTLTDFEEAAGLAMTAPTETELRDLVRRVAPPVRITPASRRLPEPLERETKGLFVDIKLRGLWQVPEVFRVRTDGSKILLDLTAAEWDSWDVEIDATTTLGDLTIIVPPGTAIVPVATKGALRNKLAPPTPGFPTITLRAHLDVGIIRLRHPSKRESKRAARATTPD